MNALKLSCGTTKHSEVTNETTSLKLLIHGLTKRTENINKNVKKCINSINHVHSCLYLNMRLTWSCWRAGSAVIKTQGFACISDTHQFYYIHIHRKPAPTHSPGLIQGQNPAPKIDTSHRHHKNAIRRGNNTIPHKQTLSSPIPGIRHTYRIMRVISARRKPHA
jgi:hypothetical protein